MTKIRLSYQQLYMLLAFISQGNSRNKQLMQEGKRKSGASRKLNKQAMHTRKFYPNRLSSPLPSLTLSHLTILFFDG
jgi:hypothetical protein